MRQKTKFEEFFDSYADDEEPDWYHNKAAWNAAIDACIEKFWTLDPAGRLVPSLEELKEK